MELQFRAVVIEWRGPAPFFYAPIPEEIGAEIGKVKKAASDGWGGDPGRGYDRRRDIRHVAVPQGRHLPAAAQGRGAEADRGHRGRRGRGGDDHRRGRVSDGEALDRAPPPTRCHPGGGRDPSEVFRLVR